MASSYEHSAKLTLFKKYLQGIYDVDAFIRQWEYWNLQGTFDTFHPTQNQIDTLTLELIGSGWYIPAVSTYHQYAGLQLPDYGLPPGSADTSGWYYDYGTGEYYNTPEGEGIPDWAYPTEDWLTLLSDVYGIDTSGFQTGVGEAPNYTDWLAGSFNYVPEADPLSPYNPNPVIDQGLAELKAQALTLCQKYAAALSDFIANKATAFKTAYSQTSQIYAEANKILTQSTLPTDDLKVKVTKAAQDSLAQINLLNGIEPTTGKTYKEVLNLIGTEGQQMLTALNGWIKKLGGQPVTSYSSDLYEIAMNFTPVSIYDALPGNFLSSTRLSAIDIPMAGAVTAVTVGGLISWFGGVNLWARIIGGLLVAGGILTFVNRFIEQNQIAWTAWQGIKSLVVQQVPGGTLPAGVTSPGTVVTAGKTDLTSTLKSIAPWALGGLALLVIISAMKPGGGRSGGGFTEIIKL